MQPYFINNIIHISPKRKISLLVFLGLFFSIPNLFGQNTTESIVTTEGFYGSGWEYSGFMEIQNDALYRSGIGWLEFSDTLTIDDSIKKLKSEIPSHKHVYMKIEAIKRTGGDYGHLGAAHVEFEVIRIIEIDTTYTVDDFLENIKKENYSNNFKLFGTIIDKETGKPMANDCFHVLGLYRSRTIKTNAKGEYEVLFYDNSGEPFTDSTRMPADEIYIIWCSDPNKMKTISLKKTKVKKASKDDSTKKPLNIKADIKLDYEF